MTPRAQELLDRFGGGQPAAALAAHLRGQRWFGGRARGLVDVRAVDLVPLRDRPDLALWSLLVRARYTAGDAEDYHLLLSRRPLRDAATGTGPSPVAVTHEDGEPVAVRDALLDPGALAELWSAIAAGETHAGVRGDVHCRNLRMAPDGPVDPGGIVPLAREQSNSSVVRERRELFKCLRRVMPGQSPELELADALARAGFDRLPTPLGALEYRPRGGGEPVLLGVVQPFLADAAEGWTLALESLRPLLAGPAPVGHPAARVASFATEADRLGRVTGGMHLAALRAGPAPGLRAHPATAADLDCWAGEMTAELDALLSGRDPALAGLRARRAGVLAVFDRIRGARGGAAIRVHGDYHLGQVLRTGDGWMVIDFEGEPRLPLAERRRLACPLRDVAGMLRSFDYAAAAALAERCAPAEPGWAEWEPVGLAWAAAAREAFWAAYTRTVDGSGLLPSGADAVALLRAFEVRKAVYEVGYELGHRPDWVGIPLRYLLAAAA